MNNKNIKDNIHVIKQLYTCVIIPYGSKWVVYYPIHYIQVLRSDLIFLLSAKFVYAFFLVQADC